MKWNNIKITIFKELRGIIRDKKSLRKLILYPLLIPIIILLFGYLFDSMTKTQYKVGTNYELTAEEQVIVKELENLEMKTYSSKEELEKAYENNEIEGYIIKEDNKYVIYADPSENSGDIISSLSSTYLETYNTYLGNKYLSENGIDPEKVYSNITIDYESLTIEEQDSLTSLLFTLVITYLVMIIMMVCVVVVTDATSGEKERGTLETILTFPIKSSELVFGKYLATSILGFIVGTASYLLSIPTFIIGKNLFESYEEVVFVTNISSILLVILVTLLTSLLGAGICMALAGRARTYKEAQSSLQFVTILPMIAYFMKIVEADTSVINVIPIANCGALLNDIVVNNVDLKSLGIVILTTVVYIVAIMRYISKQYKKEETLFS